METKATLATCPLSRREENEKDRVTMVACINAKETEEHKSVILCMMFGKTFYPYNHPGGDDH